MKLVIFDCDGTLVDSQHMIIEAMNIGLSSHGLGPLPRGQILSGVGLSLPLAIERLLPGHSPETIAAVTQGYRDGFSVLRADPANHEPLYDGIRDVVETMAARDDIVLGIATGKSVRGVDRLLNHMNWTGRFATIQTSDTHPSKPNPSMIETAMRETGMEASDTIMIGDTTFDMRMAKNAGVAALGVAWGYHPVGDLEAEGADAIAASARELIALTDRLLARKD